MFDKCDDMFGSVLADLAQCIIEGEDTCARQQAKMREHAKNYGASPTNISKLGLATKDGVTNIKTLKRVLRAGKPGAVLQIDENIVMCAEDFLRIWNSTSNAVRKDLKAKHNNIPEFKPFQYYWDAAASAERARVKTIRAKDPIAKTLMTYDGWKHFGQQVMQGQKNCYHDGGDNYYFSFEQTVPIVTAVPRLSIVSAINAEHKPLDRENLAQYPEWVRVVYFTSTPCPQSLKRDAF